MLDKRLELPLTCVLHAKHIFILLLSAFGLFSLQEELEGSTLKTRKLTRKSQIENSGQKICMRLSSSSFNNIVFSSEIRLNT